MADNAIVAPADDEAPASPRVNAKHEATAKANELQVDIENKPQFLIDSEIRNLVETEFPKGNTPSERKLIDSVIEPPNDDHAEFSVGQWAEYLGDDMAWHLAMIKRIVKQAHDDWDWDDPDNDDKEIPWLVFYNIGSARLVPAAQVRASEQGLKAVFGHRPWVWQQYALLKMEAHLRFQKNHSRDFQEQDCVRYGDSLFLKWLKDERNSDFKEIYDARPALARDKLVTHLLSPFFQLDEIVEDDERWELDNTDLSIYSYVSALGSGWSIALLVLAIQIIVPFVLIHDAIVKADSRFTAEANQALSEFTTTWDQFCTPTGSQNGKILNIAVLAIYLVKVVPETVYSFYNTTGDAENAYSRLNSLRKVVWDQGDDTFGQKLGYKMELYLNSFYIVVLFAIMLFILFLTDQVIDIILNALAIEFVHQIDEDISNSSWFDPDRRYILAGAIELVLRSVLRIEYLESPKLMCKKYHIPTDKYKEALGSSMLGKQRGMRNARQAEKDQHDPQWRSKIGSVWTMAAAYAKKTNNHAAYLQYEKPVVVFGGVEYVLSKLNLYNHGFFRRFPEFYTWSRWDKVLFLADLPERELGLPERKESKDVLGQVKNAVSSAGYVLRGAMQSIGATSPFLNHSPWHEMYNAKLMTFVSDFLVTLLGLKGVASIRLAIRRGQWGEVPFRFFDSILQWFAYVTQLMFPFYVVFMAYLTIRCY